MQSVRGNVELKASLFSGGCSETSGKRPTSSLYSRYQLVTRYGAFVRPEKRDAVFIYGRVARFIGVSRCTCYPRDAMLARVLAMGICLRVCLSVCRTQVIASIHVELVFGMKVSK